MKNPVLSTLVALVMCAVPVSMNPCWAQSAAAVPAAPHAGSVINCLQPLVDSRTLAGAVTLVASKDKVLSLEALGWADVAARRPMQVNDLFWIASMSKPITATALMILVDEGKVSIDDPVEKYLPEFKGQMVIAEQDGQHMLLKRPKHPITVKNVLSHTSGLRFSTEIEKPSLDLFPLATRVRSYAMLPLQFEPDSKYQYSNAGINTAGRIIEVVSQTPYEEFLDKRLFGPLGMKDTTFWPNAQQLSRLALCYKPTADKQGIEATPIGQLKYPLDDRTRQPMPAGGLFSTASDLGLFCRMILAGGCYQGRRILSEKAVRQMTSLQTGELPNGYGLGWSVEKKPGGAFEHGGAAATNMRIDPGHNLITVFMVQVTGGWREPGGKNALPAFRDAAYKAFAPLDK